jgi:hypothetical protein
VITPLDSIFHCDKPTGDVEVIVLVNAKKNASSGVYKQNEKSVAQIEQWKMKNEVGWLKVHVCLIEDLAAKHAGAGWARKLAMDEAIRRFALIDCNGVVCCFDADCICDANYLVELEKTFADPNVSGCSIYFEHLIDSIKYPKHQNEGILHYELHLRYLTQAIRWTGAPYGYHTVGSSMAVKAMDYIKVGGMNRRTAGEDFYFIHKIIPRGRFVNLGTTTVYPSARTSDRVPFGTGAAMNSVINSGDSEYLTYQFSAFENIRTLFELKFSLYQSSDIVNFLKGNIPQMLFDFLIESNSLEALQSVIKTSKSAVVFQMKFFQWFDAFRVIKFLNWSHLSAYSKTNTVGQAHVLLKKLNVNVDNELNIVLNEYRNLDKSPF